MKTYIAMYNMPGYMPDDENLDQFENFSDAENRLIELMNQHFDSVSEGTDISLETLEKELADARQSLLAQGIGYFQGYAYHVQEG